VIDKKIGQMFRGHNILEFKSPRAYFSVRNFDKVMAYVFQYAALEDVPITDITITIVEERHPRVLLEHLRDVWHWTVDKKWPGVYIVNRDVLPIQIIETKELSVEDAVWLKAVTDNVDVDVAAIVEKEKIKRGDDPRVNSLARFVFDKNPDIVGEVGKMTVKKTGRTLDQVMADMGYYTKDSQALEYASNLLQAGVSPDIISQTIKIPLEKVQSLYNTPAKPQPVRAGA
jgi:hypothetical protein